MQLLAACACDADLAAVLVPAFEWVAMPAQTRQGCNELCRHSSMGLGTCCLQQQTDCITHPSPRPASACLKLPAKLLCCAAAEPWILTSSGSSCDATACSQTPPSSSMLTTW